MYRTKAPSRGRYATVSLPKCDHLLQSPVYTYFKWSACAASIEFEFENKVDFGEGTYSLVSASAISSGFGLLCEQLLTRSTGYDRYC